MTTSPAKLLKVGTVARDYLDCSVRTVWQLIALGHLERVKLSARATRVTEESVLRYIDRCRGRGGRDA